MSSDAIKINSINSLFVSNLRERVITLYSTTYTPQNENLIPRRIWPYREETKKVNLRKSYYVYGSQPPLGQRLACSIPVYGVLEKHSQRISR